MATYIQLLTLNGEGRKKALDDPRSVLQAQASIAVPGVQVLGLYAVLGGYDFVNIVQAEDNEVVAQFSLELGVRAEAHVVTLPAIPVGQLAPRGEDELADLAAGVDLPQPAEEQRE